jgi:membrane fusion protein, macrolide-specific efflux system
MKNNLRTVTRGWLIAGGVITAFLILMLILWFFKPPATPEFISTEVQLGDIEKVVLADGALEATKLVNVGAQVSGQIKSLKVAVGDKVKAGQLIAEIDSQTQRNNQLNAEAGLANIRAQRAIQEANLKKNELLFERQKFLLSQDATSKQDFENAQANLWSTRAQLQSIDAQILQSQTSLATARTNLGYTRIVAPIDGTVVAVVTEEGQTVNSLQSAPTIVKLAKLDSLTVKAEISEADVSKVSPGQVVYFTLLGQPEKRYYAKLRSIEPAPQSIKSESNNSTSSTSSSAIYYNGLFDVPNPDGVLRISMTTQVYIVQNQVKNVLVIPASALDEKNPDGTYRVRTINSNNHVDEKNVRIGLNNKIVAEVLSGLNKGERVIVGEAPLNKDEPKSGFSPPRPPPNGG